MESGHASDTALLDSGCTYDLGRDQRMPFNMKWFLFRVIVLGILIGYTVGKAIVAP